MINDTIRAQIKKIKIHTKRIMSTTISGDYLSAFKGSGLEFDQIRDYQFGDDIRSIDWNASAKMNKMMVKQFIEERDRTVILVIDVSASNKYSSQQELRSQTINAIAATLAFIAHESKDKVGVLFFSDTIEKWIPPSRGNVHLGTIIENIFSIEPQQKKTNILQALKFLVNLKKRNAVVFMLSDWIDCSADYSKILKVASIEYDFVAIRILDQCEQSMPDIGLLEIQDPETGQTMVLDSRHKHSIQTFMHKRTLEQKGLFSKYKIDLLDLTTGQAFINPLVRFFHNRIQRQV